MAVPGTFRSRCRPLQFDYLEGAMYVALPVSSPKLQCQDSKWFVDTEIDWEAYMQQIEQYVSGERDYTKIYGGTGPLVYPAAHVYIYNALYRITDQGKDIWLAQVIFGMVYLVTLGIVMLCYRQAKVCATKFTRLVFRCAMNSC
jgi:hypothetical protein